MSFEIFPCRILYDRKNGSRQFEGNKRIWENKTIKRDMKNAKSHRKHCNNQSKVNNRWYPVIFNQNSNNKGFSEQLKKAMKKAVLLP